MSQSRIIHIARNWSCKGDFHHQVYSENTPARPTVRCCFDGNFAMPAVHDSF